MQRKLKLMVAVREEDRPMVPVLLGSDFDVTVSTSLPDALSLLDGSFDLIYCGLHFDDGRIFDFLREAKSNPATGSIPFVCVRGTGGELSSAMIEGIAVATKSKGADGFIDLFELRKHVGDRNMRTVVREQIYRRLGRS